jgi:aerobic carbon-monoxide dehydrogenase large subunit
MESGLEAQFRYDPPQQMTLTSAAHACVVEVDAETGFVTILRWISSEDCGVIINPAVVEGQIAGGLAQAIGMVLLEEAGYDERGNPVAATFKDYLLPAISDVPDFEFVDASTPSRAEGGFRGVGEGGAIIGPPTLVNAIADALAPFGEVPVDLPLTPSRLLDVIEGKPPREKPVSRFANRASDGDAGGEPDGDIADVPPAAAMLPGGAAEAIRESEEAVRKRGIDGRWKMVLSTPMGPQHMIAILNVEGARLTGRMESDQGSEDFEGIAEGNRLKWDLKVTKPMKITLKYDVTIEGDTLIGKVKMGLFGTARLAGERA